MYTNILKRKMYMNCNHFVDNNFRVLSVGTTITCHVPMRERAACRGDCALPPAPPAHRTA